MNGIESSSSILDKYGLYASQQAAAAHKQEDNVFLEILVTQLQNQDPLSPLENGEFIQQLASFSTVEETAQLNDQILSLVQLQQLVAGQNAFTQSADLVGKTVTYLDPETGNELSGFVGAVKLDEYGLTLDIDGKHVPVASVTGLLADGADSAQAEEESGSDSSDTNDEN